MYVCVWAHTGESTCTFMRLMTGIIMDYSITVNEAGSTSLLALEILPRPLEAKITGRATLSHHLYDFRIQTMFPRLCNKCFKH